MKHLLNNLTEKEKSSIREQHTGGMNVVTENFSRLINTKSGDVKPLVNEDKDGTINESKDSPTKSEILKMSKEELKDKYGVLKVKGTYLGEEGEFTHFKEVMGDVTCSFRYDKVTPSGLRKSTKGIKVKRDSVKFD